MQKVSTGLMLTHLGIIIIIITILIGGFYG